MHLKNPLKHKAGNQKLKRKKAKNKNKKFHNHWPVAAVRCVNKVGLKSCSFLIKTLLFLIFCESEPWFGRRVPCMELKQRPVFFGNIIKALVFYKLKWHALAGTTPPNAFWAPSFYKLKSEEVITSIQLFIQPLVWGNTDSGWFSHCQQWDAWVWSK